MHSQHFPMTIREYQLLPLHPGWKHEYYEGQAHITPRHYLVAVRIAVEPRPVRTSCTLRAATAADEPQLIEAFQEAFRHTVECCDWAPERIEAEAARCIRGFFTGRSGNPHLASRVAVAKDREGGDATVVGAALLVRSLKGPWLYVLFVRPSWQCRGVATALISTAMNSLYLAGEKRLRSWYDLGNEASTQWHQAFGFEEEPDLTLARLRLHCAEHELLRQEKLGNLSEKDRTSLASESAQLLAKVTALEEFAARKGYEAVTPILRLPS
jgi:GNAT superfamily N-acetyltransferase